ncbi:FAD-dependent oxidoreductase [Streptomyces sp. RPT161]|uniref:FAD-dependent oxidoreductase n=1 Tax=Streptomyces sp. RPT161 TaxID=3015993 RepID=UPI0022B85DA9|nr:FAD-dependent oxidoreductase [Streptomyces sp. RPT161]
MAADVIVVGGGPVGLMTAALLDAAGVRVEVYERNAQPSGQSRGATMHPRTLEVLTMLDAGEGRRISDVLMAQGRRVRQAHFAALRATLDYHELDTPFPFVLMVPQWRTERALAEYLRTRAVPVHYGAEVTDVEQSADEVRIRAGRTRRTARYLVGADGAHSMVRKAAGIDFEGTVPTMVGFVADVQLTEPVPAAQHFWNHEAGHASVVPLTETTTRVFGVDVADTGLTADQVRRRQAEPLTLDELSRALKAICGTDFGMHSPSWLSKANNSSRHAACYRKGRVLLAGDAAHVHLPAGGQGLNVGLQDATNLAWKLAAEVHGWAPERLISGEADYDSERRPIAERLVASTLAQDALMHNFSSPGEALRDMFCGFIQRRGELAAELSGWLSGLAVGYPGPEGAHPLVGTKAPDLALPAGTLLRALRPDRFLLLDFTSGASHADLGSARVEVVNAQRPSGRSDPAWGAVRAALIRPDGHVAYATESGAGLADAVAEWTGAVHGPVSAGEL